MPTQQGAYVVTFQATDNGTPPRSASCVVNITVGEPPPPFDFNGTPVVVGGFQMTLGTPASADSGAPLAAAIVVAAIATALALGGAAWYARRRWAR